MKDHGHRGGSLRRGDYLDRGEKKLLLGCVSQSHLCLLESATLLLIGPGRSLMAPMPAAAGVSTKTGSALGRERGMVQSHVSFAPPGCGGVVDRRESGRGGFSFSCLQAFPSPKPQAYSPAYASLLSSAKEVLVAGPPVSGRSSLATTPPPLRGRAPRGVAGASVWCNMASKAPEPISSNAAAVLSAYHKSLPTHLGYLSRMDRTNGMLLCSL
jgi:hypothetical protein